MQVNEHIIRRSFVSVLRAPENTHSIARIRRQTLCTECLAPDMVHFGSRQAKSNSFWVVLQIMRVPKELRPLYMTRFVGDSVHLQSHVH